MVRVLQARPFMNQILVNFITFLARPTVPFPTRDSIPDHPPLRPLGLGILVSLVALAAPARALQVRVMPENPKLGDTLTVMVQLDSSTPGQPPSIAMQGKNYPAFSISANRFRTLLPTTPLTRPGPVQIQVTGDGEVRNLVVGLRNRQFPTQRIWLPPNKSGLSATPHERSRVDAFKQLVTPQKFWQGAFRRPNGGSVSTVFGVRRYYNGKFAQNYYHRGVDYAAGTGSPVVAPAAGQVALVGKVSQGFQLHGNTVGIDHGQGVLSIFIHLSRIDVREGDFVKAGQTIGAVGSTGASTGPHLHWGLYVHGQAVDPVPWRFVGFE